MSDLPQPLVPSYVDLRSFPFMPLDVMRLRMSELAATATAEEFRAAVLLWCAAWHQVPAASLPNSDGQLTGLAGLGRDRRTWDSARDMALHGFILCSDNRLYHPVVAEKAIFAWDGRMKQKAKAEIRWAREQDAAALLRHTLGSATEDAAAMPSAMQVRESSRVEEEGAFKGYSTSNKGNLAVEGIRPDPAPGKVVKMHVHSTDQSRGQR